MSNCAVGYGSSNEEARRNAMDKMNDNHTCEHGVDDLQERVPIVPSRDGRVQINCPSKRAGSSGVRG